MFRMAIRKPVTTLMVLIMVLIIGIVGLSGLKMDLMPNIDIPVAIVNTTYVGAAPSEIETLVTKPLEESLSTISNVDNITSTSMENASLIVVTFVDGSNLDMATLDMREKIDLVKASLPDDASDPMVLKIDMSMLSTIMVGISSNTLNLDELTTLMDDELTGKFEKIEGIASATMMGGLKDEIQIIVNQEKAAGYGISVSQISQILAAENINYPAGTISQGDTKLQIRSEGEFKSVDEIRNVLLTSPMGAAVKVGDIADVSLVRAEATSFSTINGKDGIILALSKESDANIVNVSDRINSLIEDLKVTNPDKDIILGVEANNKIHAEKAENTIVLPYEYVLTDADGDYVFVLENGVATRKDVKIGISTSTEAQIVEGLSVNDKVITTNLETLTDGMPVVAMEM